MSWQWADEPSHIAPETGPNLLTGSGPWTVALTPGVEYALTVDVLGDGDTLVEWAVSVTDGETGDLDYPTISETVPGGDWVTVTQSLTAPGFDATASVTLSTPGQSRDPSLAALTGRVVLTVPGDVLAESIMASGGIVAGTPGGARVELTEEGLAAYDSTGTETALIRGEGGEFVGGEFRTSDDLPGQVTLSDTAYRASYDNALDGPGNPAPGIRITPLDTTGVSIPPGIGPTYGGVSLDGGLSDSGSRASVTANFAGVVIGASQDDGALGMAQVSAALSILRSRAADGSYGETYVDPSFASLRTYRADGTSSSSIGATSSAARMRTYREDGSVGGFIRTSSDSSSIHTYGDTDVGRSFVEVDPQRATMNVVDAEGYNRARITADGTSVTLFSAANGQRYLKLNSTGIWIESGGNVYNLEQTAQDSGWIPITHATGYQNASGGAPFEYRLMGGMIHLRGRVSPTSGTFAAGTAYTIGTLPTDILPTHTHRTLIAGGSSSQWGRIDISAGTGSLTVAPISGGMDWVDLTGTAWTID